MNLLTPKNKENFLKHVYAFANSDGGTLYLGINDSAEVIGVEDTTKLLEILPNIINQKIGIIPFLVVEHRDEKQIVKVIFTLTGNNNTLRHEDINEGINEGINSLLNYIKENEGLRISQISKAINISSKTIERWVANLKKENKIEFRGSKKTGGYFIIKK